MKPLLKALLRITVDALRKDRSLRAQITGEIRSGLSGDCSDLSGDCSGLSGNCSYLWGNCSGLSGDCSGLSGDCSGLSGNCSGLSGDIDGCEITSAERASGNSIRDLVAPTNQEK